MKTMFKVESPKEFKLSDNFVQVATFLLSGNYHSLYNSQ